MLFVRSPGDEPSPLVPSLNDDLSIQLEPDDGFIHGPYAASSLFLQQNDDATGWHTQDELILGTIELYFTSARVIIRCPNYGRSGVWSGGALAGVLNIADAARARRETRGTALVGHLRYPWSFFVSASAKPGFSGWRTIDLGYLDLEDGTLAMWQLSLHLPKGADPAELAGYMVNLVIANRYAGSDLFTPEQAERLEGIRLHPFPQLPDDGAFRRVSIPGTWLVPQGLETAPVGPTPAATGPLPASRISETASRHF